MAKALRNLHTFPYILTSLTFIPWLLIQKKPTKSDHNKFKIKVGKCLRNKM